MGAPLALIGAARFDAAELRRTVALRAIEVRAVADLKQVIEAAILGREAVLKLAEGRVPCSLPCILCTTMFTCRQGDNYHQVNKQVNSSNGLESEIQRCCWRPGRDCVSCRNGPPRRIADRRNGCPLVGAGNRRRPSQILFAQGHWAALRSAPQCEAAARPLLPGGEAPAASARRLQLRRRPPARRVPRPPEPGAARRVERHADHRRPPVPAGRARRLGVEPRPGCRKRRSSPRRAARPSMRVEARDGAGRRFADRYLLDGAPTAIDAAAARCALRWQNLRQIH